MMNNNLDDFKANPPKMDRFIEVLEDGSEVIIESQPGFSVSRADHVERRKFSGSDEQWQDSIGRIEAQRRKPDKPNDGKVAEK